MSAHPSIGAPPSSKVTVPHNAVLVVKIDVTVAINVTGWLVTARVGVASRLVVVGNDPGGVGAPATAAVLPLLAAVCPPGPLAVTTQAIVAPMSRADSV
jgi:hypothetical protein